MTRRTDPTPASSERRVDLYYSAKWRLTLLVTVPCGVVAFLVAWLLEGPSNQVAAIDTLMYPIMAAALIVLEAVLLFSHGALRPVLLTIMAGLGAFFTAKLTWLLFVLPPGADVQAQMTENFFWIPAIYLLSFILPDVRLGRGITIAFTLAILGVAVAYSVPRVLQDPPWDVIGALIQLNLSNLVFLALTSAFTDFKQAYTRSHSRIDAAESFAKTDHLTLLANRHSLQEHLERWLASGEHRDVPFALLFIDVDGFKVVNDSMGHAGGDLLLQQVAERLRANVRADDFVARISDDEFVLVIEDPEPLERSKWVAQRVLAAFAEPFEVQEHSLRVSVSIGVSISPDDAHDAGTLLRHADSAMYRVKRSGRNGVQHFHGEADEKLERQRLLERDLREALINDQLTLAFQSLHELGSGNNRGFEALLRWHHPTWGSVPPSDFIPIAEQSGLIIDIDTWVLNEACRQAKEWRHLGIGAFKISVNVSPVQFAHPNFFDTVVAALDTHRLPPQQLELELTESVVMQELEHVTKTLSQLQRLGIRIAIDDFGTGYSSLAYLRDLPINTVKIDRSFIQDLGSSTEGPHFSLAFVEAIVSLASHLDLEVIAEGVETREQCDLVARLGCHVAQGYYFSRPMTPADLEPFLAGRLGSGASAVPAMLS